MSGCGRSSRAISPPEFFTPAICNAWLALCAEVPREPQLARIQRVVHARMRSNLMTALSALVPPEQCEIVALGISSLIDGLWLRLGLHPGELSAPEALTQMADYLDHRIPHIDWNDHLRRAGDRPSASRASLLSSLRASGVRRHAMVTVGTIVGAYGA